MRQAAILLPGIVTPAELAYGDLHRLLEPSGTVLLRELAIYDGGAPPTDYSLETEITAVLKTADAAGLDRFHLGGYSAGGAIAAAFAARHPDRLASLTLMEPAWFGNEGQSEEERNVRDAIDATTKLPAEAAIPAFARLNIAEGAQVPPPPPGGPPPWMRHRPAAIRAIGPAFRDQYLDLDALRKFDRPVLFIRGGLSNPAIYLRVQERAAAVFPDFSVELFEDRHHFDPPHRAEPQRTAKLLQAFWDRAETEESG